MPSISLNLDLKHRKENSMTDKEKLDAIRAEVQNYIDAAHKAHTNITEGNFAHLLSFIDSLPEEPVSDDLDEYINELSKQFPEVSFAKLSRIAVRVAKWQKEQDQSTIEPVSEDLEKEIDRAHRIFYDEVGWDSDEGARAYVADWFAHYFANWQKHHMEANRLAHCNSISNEQAELEQKFLDEHLDKHDRMPTFLDAIEYGIELKNRAKEN